MSWLVSMRLIIFIVGTIALIEHMKLLSLNTHWPACIGFQFTLQIMSKVEKKFKYPGAHTAQPLAFQFCFFIKQLITNIYFFTYKDRKNEFVMEKKVSVIYIHIHTLRGH